MTSVDGFSLKNNKNYFSNLDEEFMKNESQNPI